jgi:hypothetical protein
MPPNFDFVVLVILAAGVRVSGVAGRLWIAGQLLRRFFTFFCT